jgi:hypothetical protein
MATSGSTDWTLNRLQVIKGALRKLAVIPSGGTPTANQISDAADSLNALVKIFQADGMPLWKVLTYTFTVTSGTSSYTIGVGSTLNNPKPLKVLQASYTVSGAVPVPLEVVNRYDFMDLPTSSTITGAPVSLNYQPMRTTGIIRLWPTPNNSTTQITIEYQSPFEDMDSDADDFDFPSEWIMPLIYNLAWALAPEYGIPPTDRNLLAQEAKYWHDYALSMGGEEGSIMFQPDTREK